MSEIQSQNALDSLLESFIQECLNINANNPLQQAINSTRYALNQSRFLRGASTQKDFTQEKILQNLELETRSKEQISHLKIAIVGQFSSGKSSFINALLGGEILPSGVTPVTAKVCEISYGENLGSAISQNNPQDTNHLQNASQNILQKLSQNPPKNSSQNLPQKLLQNLLIEVHYKDSSIKLKPLAYLHQIDSIENATISHFKLQAPIELLKNITFLDTPGFNSQNQIDTDTTNAILREVDGIIWLSLIDNVGKQSEKDILQEHLKQYSAKSLCILNQKDRLKDEQEISTSLAYANSAFSGFFAEIIPISAKQALDSYQSDSSKNSPNGSPKNTLWESSNIQAVLDFIQKELRTKSTQIKTKKILRSLKSLLISEAFRVHKSLRLRLSLTQSLKTKAAFVRFNANQSGLSMKFDTLFPQLNAKLDSLAQYIFNAQESRQIPYHTTRKNALGLKKSTTQEKTITMLPKDTLKSELTKSENTYLRDLRKIGFMISDFGQDFREFLITQEREFIAMLEEWKSRLCAYEDIYQNLEQNVVQNLSSNALDSTNPTNANSANSTLSTNYAESAKSINSLLDSFVREYALLQERALSRLEVELASLKNILILEYQNTIELTLESLDNKMTYALKKHLENPSEFEPFHLSLENVRECLNQGLHFLVFQDKLLLTNALYKTTLFSLSEAINDFYEQKEVILQTQIQSLKESKLLLLSQAKSLKNID
ncbi:dynamin family protein [Helicobacter sp. MIT 01-3238]|uniref:dynamin family protein n=1 Tax=Helicobacter sp. MIT 01-3238 TaxID=398627 RepID=UPI000E1E3990|nr:dynamin family protein [Helicobacter sp. MIT 01-3238]RDU55427.1 hypothetical protein CQA40_01255 [Helicobacter sp. MIT 01-3238]